MDGRSFINIARQFCTSQDEAERRTSIGRSYYALYNLLITTLSERGVIFKETPDDHYKLIGYLTKCGNRTAGLVGITLKDLRLERNRSDYEMKITVGLDMSDLVYKKATRAITEFDSISAPELQQIVDKIQALP